jgi:hypothetical protein
MPDLPNLPNLPDSSGLPNSPDVPDLRSSRFLRPFTRHRSTFSRSRDQSTTGFNHSAEQSVEHSKADDVAGFLAIDTGNSGSSETEFVPRRSPTVCVPQEPRCEPQWALADGHRSYRAIPTPGAEVGAELLADSHWQNSASSTSASVRPDLGAAGPKGDPGDEGEDENDDDNEHHSADGELVNELVDEGLADEGLVDGELLALEPWPIETPDDAIDTFELHRSFTFHQGLAVLVLDHDRMPILHVALRGNPVDDIDCALRLFCPSLPNGCIPAGLILGIVRAHHREAPQSVLDSGAPFDELSIWVDPLESAAWREAAWKLHDEGIKLHDVIVIEPDRWMSLARAAGLVTYDTLQCA